jgi:hypothetical protein
MRQALGDTTQSLKAHRKRSASVRYVTAAIFSYPYRVLVSIAATDLWTICRCACCC